MSSDIPRCRESRSLVALLLGMALALGAPILAQTPQIVPEATDTPITAVTAQKDSALEAQTRQLASELRCPVCQGLSLQDSPSELAQEMRNVVRGQLREGKTPNEVKQYFINRYGEWILMEPQAHGFNWLVYALPTLVLLGGLTVIYVALKRWTAGVEGVAGAPVEEEPDSSRDVPAEPASRR